MSNLEPIKDSFGKEWGLTPLKSSSEPSLASESRSTTCPICRGGGFVHPRNETGKPDYSAVVPCACRLEEIVREHNANLLRYCELPPATASMTLDNFQTLGVGILEVALATARAFASGDSPIRFLTFVGKVDLGKTHLAVGITREWLKRGLAARFGQVPLLLMDLKAGFDADGENAYRQRLDRLCRVPLLVLDDLGTEKPTAWAIEQIQLIIDYRAMHLLHTVVTTNRDISTVLGGGDEDHVLASVRIASRLQRQAYCRIVVLGGPESRDWRLAR